MNKKELFKHLETLHSLLSIEEIPQILNAIKLFSPLTERFKKNAKNLLEDGNLGINVRREIKGEISNIIEQEKNLKYRKIIVESSRLEDELQIIKNFIKSENDYYVEFLTEIEKKLEFFLDYYEKHTRSYSVSSCLSLSLCASELHTAINSTNQILKGVLAINVTKNTEDKLYRLDLYLSNVQTLREFSEKLNAIAEIYSELLVLYGESEFDNPIIIEHLENGSLWIKIAGHSLTATLLTSLLTISTQYYQENYTATGKLQQLPISIKVVSELLQITEKLEKDGVDTKEIKDNIESATKKISKKLDILLSDQPKVEINNIIHSIGDSFSTKLIEQQKNKQIEHRKDS
jgi:hypothetical protein